MEANPEMLCSLSATELLSRTLSGQCTVLQVAEAMNKRIQERQPLIQGYVHLDPIQLRNEASNLDLLPVEERRKLPLFGVPVAVKDIFYTKGMPTRHGSDRYSKDQPEVDASIVQILRTCGALIIGKTVTTEFASTMHGKATVNPHDFDHTPGGSSSGSAAVVADHQAPLSIGTQTFGSIVRPASYCGLYGFKPTWSAVSIQGARTCSPTMDTIGFFSRNLSDLIVLADVLHLHEDYTEEVASTGKNTLRIGWCKTPAWTKASKIATKALQTTVQSLAHQGVELEEIVLPQPYDSFAADHLSVVCGEMASGLLHETHMRRPGEASLDSIILDFCEKGRKQSRGAYLSALNSLARLRENWDALSASYDAVLTLSTPDEAPRGLNHTGDPSFCTLWTSLHVPIINLPWCKGSTGLPMGLSLTTGRFRDRELLDVAVRLQEIFDSAIR